MVPVTTKQIQYHAQKTPRKIPGFSEPEAVEAAAPRTGFHPVRLSGWSWLSDMLVMLELVDLHILHPCYIYRYRSWSWFYIYIVHVYFLHQHIVLSTPQPPHHWAAAPESPWFRSTGDRWVFSWTAETTKLHHFKRMIETLWIMGETWG